MIACKRGDIVLVLFPDSNLRTAKRRPGLIVQSDDLGTGIPQVIVAMITSNLARLGHGSRVLVSFDTPGTGLLTESVVMTDNLSTVLISELDRAIGALADLAEVDKALRFTLDL